MKIQKKFPSFEFASEGTPREQRQIEQLTSSWDQIGDIRRNYKVEIETNMFRFVFPEHPLNMVSRWSVGSDKDSIIKRAAFNGMGLVIWQDVFGAWLPFSKKQKQLIKKLKNILNKFHDIILSFWTIADSSHLTSSERCLNTNLFGLPLKSHLFQNL